jgi:hypothetical protein
MITRSNDSDSNQTKPIRSMSNQSGGGGRVRIATANRDALNAVHDFVIYQIQDHQTGDPERP